MSLIKVEETVIRTIKATLTHDTIKELVAADLRVHPNQVSLNFKYSGGPDGYGNNDPITFSKLEVIVNVAV